jgi:hypothetical protein
MGMGWVTALKTANDSMQGKYFSCQYIQNCSHNTASHQIDSVKSQGMLLNTYPHQVRNAAVFYLSSTLIKRLNAYALGQPVTV